MARTVGIEEEFLLVDPASGGLRSAGEEVSTTADENSAAQYEEELKGEQVELGTRPHESVPDLLADLRERRAELGAAARASGARLAALATAPVRATPTVTAHERYERIHSEYGTVADLQLVCGMHVHVSVADDAEGVRVIDALQPWLAVLVALSANSPFWDGRDTGYESFRTVLWGQWPTAGPTGRFGTPERYEELRRTLLDSGAAMDEGMVYFAARLSPKYPTVEVRVADVCVEPDDAVVIAALIRGLVSSADSPDVRPELVRAAIWRAARDGVGGQLLDLGSGRLRPAWDVVDALVAHVSPALEETGDRQLVTDGLDEIRRRGTGAQLQRDAYARRGRLTDILEAVVARSSGA